MLIRLMGMKGIARWLRRVAVVGSFGPNVSGCRFESHDAFGENEMSAGSSPFDGIAHGRKRMWQLWIELDLEQAGVLM